MTNQEIVYFIEVDKNMNIIQLFFVLDFVNYQELQTFLKSSLFRPFYEAYVKNFLNSEKTRLKKSDKFRTRSSDLRVHQLRIVQFEKWRMKRFSNKFLDKSEWNVVDHKTVFMYDVYTQNTQIYDDLFFSKQIDDVERNRRTWNLIKYVLDEEANSRLARKEDDTSKQFNVVLTSSLNNLNDFDNQISQSSSSQFNVVLTSSLNDLNDFDNQIRQSSLSSSKDHLLRARRLSSRLLFVESQTAEESTIEIVERHEQSLTFDDSRANDVANDELLLEDDEDEALLLFVAERLVEESISFTFNVKKRFWIIWLIDQTIKFVKDIETLKSEMNWTSDVNEAAHRDALNWMRNTQKTMTENTLIFEQFDAVTSKTFDDMKSFFNNLNYQRNDLQIAFESIDIVWQESETIFRVSEMIVAEELSYWQLIAIHWLREMRKSSLVKECIYANYMSLDKIWSVIVFLLTISNMQKSFLSASCLSVLQKSSLSVSCLFVLQKSFIRSYFCYLARRSFASQSLHLESFLQFTNDRIT